MNVRLFAVSLISLLLSMHTSSISALTMGQVSEICHSFSGECSDHSIIQAYVGGALDLLGTLDEQTDYLGGIYCKDTKELFDVKAIIRFMEQRSKQYASDNAMLVLIRYIEENGGCKP